jgi:iron complex outermembrane receptor protein
VVAYGSGNAASYTTLPGFALANVKLGYQAMRNVRLEAGVNNLFDANYQLSDGYPMPGRVWFVNGVYQF